MRRLAMLLGDVAMRERREAERWRNHAPELDLMGRSSHLAASRQAAAKRPASAVGFSAQAKDAVSPLPQSQRHAWCV